MVYTLNIPNPAATLAASVGPMQTNTNALDSIFGADHIAFSAASSNGLHKQVSFMGNSPAVFPHAITQEGITLFSNISGSRFTLSYIERNTGATHETVQLTAKTAPLSAPIGRSFLPGKSPAWDQSMGVLIQWGSIAVPAATATHVGFSPPFETAPYTIQLTLMKTDSGDGQAANIVTGSVNQNGFDIYHNASAAHDVYWTAIGREQI